MSGFEQSDTVALGHLRVRRLGYGAMHLSGPGVFGPPKDHAGAPAVLREAVACGENHIDTSDYYGPHVTNRLIYEALHPYPDDHLCAIRIELAGASTRVSARPVGELRKPTAKLAFQATDVGAVADALKPFQHQRRICAVLLDLFDWSLRE